ncbi:hypothetical protein WAI453_001344 [Rhynchosporium graminicola]
MLKSLLWEAVDLCLKHRQKRSNQFSNLYKKSFHGASSAMTILIATFTPASSCLSDQYVYTINTPLDEFFTCLDLRIPQTIYLLAGHRNCSIFLQESVRIDIYPLVGHLHHWHRYRNASHLLVVRLQLRLPPNTQPRNMAFIPLGTMYRDWWS